MSNIRTKIGKKCRENYFHRFTSMSGLARDGACYLDVISTNFAIELIKKVIYRFTRQGACLRFRKEIWLSKQN